MDATTLADLIAKRHRLLVELLGMSEQQIAAIHENRMTDLMRILSGRQTKIQQLADVTTRLQPALGDDPQDRTWPNETARQHCRQQQQECNQMHQKLIEIESLCEQALGESRSQIENRLERLNEGHRAVTGYIQAASFEGQAVGAQSSGNRLDLSSD